MTMQIGQSVTLIFSDGARTRREIGQIKEDGSFKLAGGLRWYAPHDCVDGIIQTCADPYHLESLRTAKRHSRKRPITLASRA